MTSKKILINSLIVLFIFTFTVSESISFGSAILFPADPDEELALISKFKEPIDVENTTINSMFLVTQTPVSEQFGILLNFSFVIDVEEGSTLDYTVSINFICTSENITFIWVKHWNKTVLEGLQRNITDYFSFISPKRLEKVDVILKANSTPPHYIHSTYDQGNEYKIESYFSENSIDYYNTVIVYYEDWEYNFSFHSTWNNHSIPIIDQDILITIEKAGTPSVFDNFSMNITLGYLNFESANDIEDFNLASDCLINWTKQENSQCSISMDVDSIPETFQPSLADLQIRSGFTFHIGDDEFTIYVPFTNEPNFLPPTLHPFVWVGIGILVSLVAMSLPSIYSSIKKRK